MAVLVVAISTLWIGQSLFYGNAVMGATLTL
jgi:hypothetical protein